jgi:hypothetical protein
MPPSQVDVLIERVNNLIDRIDAWEKRQTDCEERIITLEIDQARLRERQGLWAGGLAGLQVILAGIAAWLGMSK